MKERKLLYLRTPHHFHASTPKWKRRWLAWKLSSGYYNEPNIRIRSLLGGKYKVVDNCISEILPWLYIGKVETAQNETFLADRKFTHILNCTDSVSNYLILFIYLYISYNVYNLFYLLSFCGPLTLYTLTLTLTLYSI